MKPTVGLGWKSLVSKLHPPLPMSPKDSARLLKLLNASFKQQLNQQREAGLPDTEQHADLHLRSILTNPLFNRRDSFRSRHGSGKTFGRVQDLLKRPMDYFIEEVATGSATIETATFCLQSHYNNCLASPDADVASAMRASGAGTIVANWLWSSGLEESGDFFKHHHFMDLLIDFSIAESHHDRVQHWLQSSHLLTHENPSPGAYRNLKKLLFKYISSEVSTGKGLESATALFVQIIQTIRQKGTQHRLPAGTVYPVAYYLTLKLIDVSKTKEFQATTLEPFMKVVKDYRLSKNYLGALHDVYIAEIPNPTSTLKYFQQLSTKQIVNIKPPQRPHVIFLGLKAAELLLDDGRHPAAISIMDTLQDTFPDAFGLHASQKDDSLGRSSEEAEQRSIRLLDALALG